jgi:hypothetical protein
VDANASVLFSRLGLLTYHLDAIKEFGTVNGDSKTSVSYGILFDKTANTCMLHCTFASRIQFDIRLPVEALNGTLRAAKRQKKVNAQSISISTLSRGMTRRLGCFRC